jgi:dienelactone hydrolase
MQRSSCPAAAIDAIAGWLAGWSTAAANRPASSAPRDAAVIDSTLERTVRFGPNQRLFGIIGRPPVPTSRPSIVLFNTGVEHHIGPHRMYVPLARRWIAAGHVVLRFDIGGIGDSAPPPGMDENVAYPPHMLDDARDAVELVRQSAPGRPLVAIGLCSGGWLAFRAAAAGLDVDAVVAINPPLYLREPDRGAKWLAEQRELERYRQSMRVPGKWAKALRGRASYAAFTRVAGAMLSRSVANRVGGAFTDALPDGLARDLVTIADRRIRTLLVFSARGEALGYFEAHAQPAFRRGSVREIVRSVVVEGAGHSFRPRAAQQRVCELLTSFVDADEPAPGARTQPRVP